MQGRLSGDEVVVGGDARQRYYDSRGYGRPLDGNELALSRVEAAHLLFRGDLDSVDGMGFREFFAAATGDGFGARFLVYADLRSRGFYLSPARADRVADPDGVDFVVYPRGKGPWDDAVAYRMCVVDERVPVPAADLGDVVLAVVDEESEITYLATDRPALDGATAYDPPVGVEAVLVDDRVVVWEPPADLHERGFYGQPLAGRDADGDALQLSLVEAAYLADVGSLRLTGAGDAAGGDTGDGEEAGGVDALVERGRAVEGERFDRRLAVYAALRDDGLVPKTGFKFGADFRVYDAVESVSDLGHSEYLVRVLPAGFTFEPRDLALDVRLAHGVRKQMVFAFPNDGVSWLGIRRLTP
ncbi:tRNA-intron lyase [Halobacteriaceae archaeon GCM10025711]